MTALTQEDVDIILNQYKVRSQAIKENVFDLVLNSNSAITLDDVYYMDKQDFMILKNQISENIKAKIKNHVKSLT